jgi:hypothetical protein
MPLTEEQQAELEALYRSRAAWLRQLATSADPQFRETMKSHIAALEDAIKGLEELDSLP